MIDSTEPAVLAANCSLPAMLVKAAAELDASLVREGRPGPSQRLVIAVLSSRLRSLAKDAIHEASRVMAAEVSEAEPVAHPDLFS